MKKSLLVLGILAGVAHADTTTLYGQIGYDVTVDDATNVDSKTALNLKSNSVRLGIKGDEQLNNGLSAFYNLEFQYNFKTGNNGELQEIRQANMGLKGQYGKIAFGKMTTLRGSLLGQADKLESLSGAGYGQTRAAKVVHVSSDYNGIIVGASAILDGKDDDESDIIKGSNKQANAYEAGAIFSLNGINTGVWYSKAKRDSDKKNEFFSTDLFGNTSNTNEVLGASFGYENDQYGVGFDYEHRASAGNYYALGGQYFLNENNTFSAGVEVFDPSKNATYTKVQKVDDEEQVSKGTFPRTKNQYRAFLGYKYNFSKRTFAWVEGAYIRDEGAIATRDDKTYQVTDVKKQSGYTAVVGIRHNF